MNRQKRSENECEIRKYENVKIRRKERTIVDSSREAKTNKNEVMRLNF